MPALKKIRELQSHRGDYQSPLINEVLTKEWQILESNNRAKLKRDFYGASWKIKDFMRLFE